jgi:DNA-binding MarR family transcriptional regulator
MSSRPVKIYISILRSLLPHQLNVNRIYTQTGLSFKQAVTRAIKELEKEGLVTRLKDKKHTQMQYIHLTELGRELADMAVSFEQYKNSLTNFEDKEYDQFNISKSISQDSLKNILENRGWDDKEIFWYKESLLGLGWIRYITGAKVSNILLYRCALSLYKFSFGDIAKAIMNSILVDATTFLLSEMIDEIEYHPEVLSESEPKSINKEIKEVYWEVADQQLDDISQTMYPFPKVIYGEVKDLLVSYLSLLKPPKEVIVRYMEIAKETVEETKTYSREQSKKERRLHPDHFPCLLEAYQEYLSK